MGNFNDFIKNDYVRNEELNNKSNKSKQNNEKLEEMINEYSKLSGNELMNEFIKLTIEKKKKGELSNSELDSIRKTIIPYLNDEQKVMLDKLLSMVENV